MEDSDKRNRDIVLSQQRAETSFKSHRRESPFRSGPLAAIATGLCDPSKFRMNPIVVICVAQTASDPFVDDLYFISELFQKPSNM
jgi:hypothetical protein